MQIQWTRTEFALAELDRVEPDWACGDWVYGGWVYGGWVYGNWACGDWAPVGCQDVPSKGSSHSAGNGTSKAFSVSEIKQ